MLARMYFGKDEDVMEVWSLKCFLLLGSVIFSRY